MGESDNVCVAVAAGKVGNVRMCAWQLLQEKWESENVCVAIAVGKWESEIDKTFVGIASSFMEGKPSTE